MPVLAVVVNYQNATADVYQRQPDGAWTVLEAGIDLHQLEAEIDGEQAAMPSPWSEQGAALPAERREGVPGGVERRG